jgi:hypothetical protein
MVHSVSTDKFFKQNKPVDYCNGEVWCFPSGTDRISKYYLVEFRLQRGNVGSNTLRVTYYTLSNL